MDALLKLIINKIKKRYPSISVVKRYSKDMSNESLVIDFGGGDLLSFYQKGKHLFSFHMESGLPRLGRGANNRFYDPTFCGEALDIFFAYVERFSKVDANEWWESEIKKTIKGGDPVNLSVAREALRRLRS